MEFNLSCLGEVSNATDKRRCNSAC